MLTLENIKVSVVIPTYNSGKTLERAIKSVLNQTSSCVKEILVCDDCSTDDTIEIAKRYGCRIFINEKNSGGPNKGRNVGIKNATGTLIAFLDHDDEWLPEKLEIQIKEILSGADFVYSPGIIKTV